MAQQTSRRAIDRLNQDTQDALCMESARQLCGDYYSGIFSKLFKTINFHMENAIEGDLCDA
jgi:hypothetical protein